MCSLFDLSEGRPEPMSDRLTPRQTLLVWSLLGLHGQALQSAIVPKVAKEDRDALEQKRLIKSRKQNRSFRLELDDAGWAWAAKHLGDDLPPAFKALQTLLTRLSEHLEKSGETLADFIGPAPAPPEPPAKPLSDAQLRSRIRKAYLALTGGKKNMRVLLSDLRGQLAEIDRATLDAALTRLHESAGTATLMRLDNPKDISPAVTAAQLMFKGEPLHLLWIAR